jgi:hypothetical protein
MTFFLDLCSLCSHNPTQIVYSPPSVQAHPKQDVVGDEADCSFIVFHCGDGQRAGLKVFFHLIISLQPFSHMT